MVVKRLIHTLLNFFKLEPYEEFKLANDPNKNYRFTEDELQVSCVDDTKYTLWSTSTLTLNTLISAGAIIRPPFKPRIDQYYWTFKSYPTEGPQWLVRKTIWQESSDDYMALKLGIVYRSSEDAFKDLKRAYEEITGKEYKQLEGCG